MGQSQSQSGGANLPPELLSHIGEYSDPITATRMRETGREGSRSVFPRIHHDPKLEDWLRLSPDPSKAVVWLLMEEDTEYHRRLFDKTMTDFIPGLIKLHRHFPPCITLVDRFMHNIESYLQQIYGATLEELPIEAFENHRDTILWIFRWVDMKGKCDVQRYLETMLSPNKATYSSLMEARIFLAHVYGRDIESMTKKKPLYWNLQDEDDLDARSVD